jgi:hypothetical protein
MNKENLEKGLAALQHAADAGNPVARRNALLEKAKAGELTADENDELVKSLGGGSELKDAATASLQTEGLQKSLDVSDYLREHHEGLQKSLGVLCDRLEKSEAQDQGFRIALAQTLTGMGDMVKGLADQVEVLSGRPAGPVKSQGVVGAPADGAAVEKSMAGQPSGRRLTKSQVLDIMDVISEGGNGFPKGGENMATAIAKYESGTEISKALSEEVLAIAHAPASNQPAA